MSSFNSRKDRKNRKSILGLRTREKAKDKDKEKDREKSKSKEGEPSRQEIPGLLLLAALLITGIPLVSEFVRLDGNNLLGPYLGEWWADTLNQGLGWWPLSFYLAALIVWGVQLISGRDFWRPMAIVAALGFMIGLSLSVKHLGTEQLSPVQYEQSGGWVGNFLAQRIFQPIFGTETFGPYLITGILIFFLVVWGFQLSLSALLARTANAAGAMGRSLADGWRGSPEGENSAAPETAIAVLPLDRKAAKARAKQEIRVLPTAEDSPEEEKAKLEALLESGNLEGLDPLTIRKVRDLALERKRVNELNEWEQKNRNPEIAGIMGKAGSEELQALKQPVPITVSPAAEPKKKARKKDAVLETAPEKGTEGKNAESPSTAEFAAEDTDPPEINPDVISDEIDIPAADPKPKSAKKANPIAPATDPAAEAKPAIKYDPYRLPDLNAIFPDPPVQPLEFTEEELREQSKLLEDQLMNFKVMGKVTQICPGPVITRYEVELAPGVKVNRISNLADDLALALRAKSIRILAPIPGKSVVGIEVPNRKAQIVYIKEILAAPEFKIEEDTLKVAMGKTIAGEPYVMDLTRAPHVLIAGQTGSGKSVCINSFMASLLMSKTPDELRMILVDPKMVELKPYDAIPHLLYPVITQPDVAVKALKWATVEMDRRYEVLSSCGVRNIKGFNQKAREGRLPDEMDPLDKGVLPYILIVIDELADLMMVAGKEVETNIARIAQKARAVGIHLILATQRPSTNVITGTIKANLPARLSFQVASQIDARTVLDRQGAEKLLGRGDMLFRPIEFPEPIRLHGCFLDDEQCEKVAGLCSNQFVNYPQVKTFDLEEESGPANGEAEERDDKFAEAAELVVQVKQASVSLLQRRLSLGYARSGRLVDQLERAGIVGRERGSKPREVLMSEEELRSFLQSNRSVDEA